MKTRLLDEFRTGPKDVTFTFKGDEVTVWVRRPNTTEKAMCEQYARIASREMRNLLTNTKSEERQALVDKEIALMERGELEMLWMAGELYRRTFEYERETLENRDETFIPEPETEDGIHYPSQEELDRHDDAVEAIEQQREESVAQAQKSIAEQLLEEAHALPIKTLRKNAVPRRIEQLCGQAYNEEYSANLLARCTFEDEEAKRPMFKTVTEVRSFFRDYPEIAEVISMGHQSLMDNPEEIKN